MPTATPAPRLTAKQRNHARRLKRKAGPAGLRRAARRAETFPVLECGCRHTSDGLKRCEIHNQDAHAAIDRASVALEDIDVDHER
jgi:hypothetical protein